MDQKSNNVVYLADYRKCVLKETPNTDFWDQRHMADVMQVLIDSGWISPNATYEVDPFGFYDIRINPPGGNTG